eukprot:TRINITY_DN1412_c0_g1_i3.p1 TRINITY_DN1412_c0_g1~~TRINITY_DN1412_c0_g1_i3.p1  ORF type:complete len:595 (+),score=72.51 TRINITY_DN1412_c0_g1_i3:53-1837(+)
MEADANLTRRRVKVYDCNDESGQWDDRGTGQVSIEPHPSGGLIIRVVAEVVEEENKGILLEQAIYHEVAYQKQQDTLIVWTDPSQNADIALSFQEPLGCEDIWDRIFSYQKQGRREDDENIQPARTSLDVVAMDLPEPELKNLDVICEKIGNATTRERDSLVVALRKENYIQRLLQVFTDCEDLEDTASLDNIYKIFKTMVFLNDTDLYDILFADENILNVIGTFEYDPVMKTHAVHHRQFLQDKSRFKCIVDFRNPAVDQRVHQNFRLQYLKDVVLPRLLDDQTFTTINNFIYLNNQFIVTQLASDPEVLNELFTKLSISDTQLPAWGFLQEMCGLARALMQHGRTSFFQALCSRGLLKLLEGSLKDRRVQIRLSCMDILTHIVTHDAAFARHALLSQENATLAKLLMKQMVSDTDSGVQEQLKEVIRCLVDPEAMDQQVEKDEFLTLFYDSCIDVVMQPVVGPESVFQSYGGAVKDHCMDLLAFCVRAHGLRIKYYILRHNVAQKVLRLMSAREKYLVTSTVRFFRALVGMKEEVYDRYIVKHNLFAPIMKAFTENGDRYNLLNSTVLDLVEFIRKVLGSVLLLCCCCCFIC